MKFRRAIVVLMSARGQTVKDITTLMPVGEDYVRDVIHAFNEQRFGALDPNGAGRPKTISDKVREHICLIARTSPAGWKITTTWKASTDPDFIAKMHRVLTLYDTPPTDGRVICVDEFGPLNLMPRKGEAWGPVRRPRRLRTMYNRYGGVRHMLAALDLATGKLYYRIRPRKRWREFLGLLKALRARRPREKQYVVLDNFSPHKHAKSTRRSALGRPTTTSSWSSCRPTAPG
ncbi:helix-turn-helix domain-containing protein [Streptomyces mirabilis]